MKELWQLYDENGEALAGKGASKEEVLKKGLLHGASHVWIWREEKGRREVLLQKRAATKRTWPNRYDISAAGHIDLGETPIEAAIRESKEEISIDIDPENLARIGIHRAHLQAGALIENEFQFMYSLRAQEQGFSLRAEEVAGIEWRLLDIFEVETVMNASAEYVPHGTVYYQTIVEAIRDA